ncbi:hypothetical protein [Acinetobacter ursingii]|uniref:hypothetical protein n=1 Tax=Acinetobacter ursingii TaxID=108980 RepID=UPI00124EE2FB|nr:hypothetical protein [Acinetobacter ursingii]MCU4307144.1 hypothetical protein [Acinetobacter ursingii]MCU4373161.1 hypothetical protein [Acinetobacter ursingii]MCU4382809.1 hypothetical protein [Acinetobacter ursingii]MDG9993753.1 hypothetical protein [Acinetobacter ursingii]MDH0205922.1 hypothetical protein [Acinetobacter ursingii]
MKTIYTDDPLVNNELFSLATQLYVRLRRETGRVVDAVYMAKNNDYAQEIMYLAASVDDRELKNLAEKLDKILNGATTQSLKTSPKIESNLAGLRSTSPELQVELQQEEVPHHYIGALR